MGNESVSPTRVWRNESGPAVRWLLEDSLGNEVLKGVLELGWRKVVEVV